MGYRHRNNHKGKRGRKRRKRKKGEEGFLFCSSAQEVRDVL
jgi:hypothetical protein